MKLSEALKLENFILFTLFFLLLEYLSGGTAGFFTLSICSFQSFICGTLCHQYARGSVEILIQVELYYSK